MIQLGDTLSLKPSVEGGENIGPRPGRVVYIHPEGRYYVAEFEFARGDRRARFREAYFMQRSRTREPELRDRNMSRVYSNLDGRKIRDRKRKKN